MKKISYILMALLSLSATHSAFAFTPHNEPILHINGPKPNVYIYQTMTGGIVDPDKESVEGSAEERIRLTEKVKTLEEELKKLNPNSSAAKELRKDIQDHRERLKPLLTIAGGKGGQLLGLLEDSIAEAINSYYSRAKFGLGRMPLQAHGSCCTKRSESGLLGYEGYPGGEEVSRARALVGPKEYPIFQEELKYAFGSKHDGKEGLKGAFSRLAPSLGFFDSRSLKRDGGRFMPSVFLPIEELNTEDKRKQFYTILQYYNDEKLSEYDLKNLSTEATGSAHPIWGKWEQHTIWNKAYNRSNKNFGLTWLKNHNSAGFFETAQYFLGGKLHFAGFATPYEPKIDDTDFDGSNPKNKGGVKKWNQGAYIDYKRPFHLDYRCQQNHVIYVTLGTESDIKGDSIESGRIYDDRELDLRITANNDLNKNYVYRNSIHNLAVNQVPSTYKLSHDSSTALQALNYLTDIDLFPTVEERQGPVDGAGKPWATTSNYGHKDDAGRITFNILSYWNNNTKVRDYHKAMMAAGKRNDREGKNIWFRTRSQAAIGFMNIMNSIVSNRSGTATAMDQITLSTDTLSYQTNYSTVDAQGEITAHKYDPTGESAWNTYIRGGSTKPKNSGRFSSDILWSTANRIASNQGQFYTFKNSQKQELSTKNLSLDDDAEAAIFWLKGKRLSGHNLRIRSRGMGDIINSNLVYAAKDRLYINLGTLGEEQRKDFEEYLLLKNKTLNYNLLIASSNDGLINFIVANKNGSYGAATRYSSVFPQFLGQHLYNKKYDPSQDPSDTNRPSISQDGKHRYWIDGQTNLFDANISGAYRTIGITGTGATFADNAIGGYVGFQLFNSGVTRKIKPPKSERNVDWNKAEEIFDHIIKSRTWEEQDSIKKDANLHFQLTFEITKNSTGFDNLGYAYSSAEFFNHQPEGSKTASAVAVIGNGPGSKDGGSYLYLFDAMTGKPYDPHNQGIKNGVLLSPNGGGAFSPTLVVKMATNGYQQLKAVYVADLKGTLYRVDFDSKLKPTVTAIFKTEGGLPITVKPVIATDNLNPNEENPNVWIYFGTGKALELEDRGVSSQVENTFYGIRDKRGQSNGLITNLYAHKESKDRDPISSNPDAAAIYTTTVPDHLVSRHLIGKDYQGNNVYRRVLNDTFGGWKFTLKSDNDRHQFFYPAQKHTGERVIRPAQVNNNQFIQFVTWGIKEGDINDPCLLDIQFGKSIALQLFTGGASDESNVKDRSGVAYNLTAPGMPALNAHNDNTGPFSGGGSNTNNLEFITGKTLNTIKGGDSQGSYIDESKRVEQNRPTGLLEDGSGSSLGLELGVLMPVQISIKVKPRRLYLKHLL